jgi:hypothetical protein
MKTSAYLRAVIAFSLIATPALAQRQQQQQAAATTKDAGPAPRRDISGHWLGPVSPRKEPPPPMTALGQQLFDATKPLQGPRAVPIAATNDPLVTCNPEGFPRSALFETRGFAFEHVPRRTLQLLQYQRIWREIWTDGRPLPTNVGAAGKDTRDPRYYGYSIGRWADDSTFVVTTTGFNEDAWADERGDPRSMDAKVEERYRRIDHDHLEVSVTIDDPKMYTKPYFVMKQVYTWAPVQEFEEQLCIPSEALEYRETFRPAGTGKSILATHYAVGAAQRGERAAVYLFEEGLQTYLARAARLEMNPAEFIKRKLIAVEQIDPAALSPSEFAYWVRESVERDHARIVIIDSLNGYLAAMPDEGVLASNLRELVRYLSQQGVLTLLVVGEHGLVGSTLNAQPILRRRVCVASHSESWIRFGKHS